MESVQHISFFQLNANKIYINNILENFPNRNLHLFCLFICVNDNSSKQTLL